jgi:aryl-alcohol dehydrogenase-like predicted oxidoreductase
MMKKHKIPNTDLEVSALCFGASSLGTSTKGELADGLITQFIEAGGCFFDTAHCYSFWEKDGLGASERELGACLRRLGHWDDVVIATKGGHPDGGENYRRPDYYISENIIASDIDDSLERLGADRIDLYFLHRDDPRVTVDEIIGILNDEIKRERIRYIGASNWSTKRIAEANEYATKNGLQGFVASEVQWSLAEPNWKLGPEPTMRHVTNDDAEFYAQFGIPILAYSSTAGGYFSGNNMALYDNPTNRERLIRTNELAEKLGHSPTQIALAYLMNQSSCVIPIFRTANHEHLAEIMDSVFISLSIKQVHWLRDGI